MAPSTNAPRDANYVPTMLLESSTNPGVVVPAQGDQTTGRLLVDSASGSGTVTDVSVVTANGFAGTVATSTTTPAITLTTTVTGLIKGNGTAMSAATAGTDYTALAFKTIAVSGQSDVVADSAADTLTLVGSGVTITTDATTDTITFTVAGSGITIGTTTITSGTTTRILYDNAGVVGEYTITGSGTVVAMATAPIFITSITTPSVLATANDSGAIGASGTAFSDLFLASGAVINFLAGAVTITHSANTLTIAGSAYTTLALGATSITLTGSIAATGARVTKGWFTDIESTNAPTVSGAAVYYTGGPDVAVADGGTGKSSWTQYLIPYADTTTSFSQIAIGTAGQVLTSNGAGAAPTFQANPKYVPIFSTCFEASGRFDTFGTNDATATYAVQGLDYSAGASQNGGRLLYMQNNTSLASVHSITGFTVRPRNGEASTEVWYIGMGEATGLTVSDTAITYTSRSNYGIKCIGDGTNLDIWATNAERGGTETATEIISNSAPGETFNVNSMEYTGGTNIVWRQLGGTALATHTTNLPTTAMAGAAGQFIVTQNTQFWLESFSLSVVI